MAALVLVGIFYDIHEARVAKAALDDRGICCFLYDDGIGSVFWPYVFAGQGLRLCAIEPHAQDARDILDDIDERLDEEGVELCPKCGSGNVFRPCSGILGLLTAYLCGFPLYVLKSKRHCRHCGHAWKGT